MSDPRVQRLETRLKVLELEAQLQRTTLAAGLHQWGHSRPWSFWLGEAAHVAGHVAGDLLAKRSVRWMLIAAALRGLRNWRRNKKPNE